MANVIVAGGSEETRLLLRGLVRLHHHRVVGEGPGPEVLAGLAPDVVRPVLLLDADLDDPAWVQQVNSTLKAHPDAKAVLLTSHRSVVVEERARTAGFHSVLRRPFAVRDLVQMIEEASPGTPGGAPSAPTPPSPPA